MGIQQFKTVNLDGATESELKKVASNTSFPKSYARYAGIKLEASNARKKGDIAKALMLEAHADQLYSKMTGNLKW